ncbi:uncharacterized protein CANTADRAFT_27334 [Suhomyces tanzawaensis NRRL Y-17324]|uniref:Uncharacterized protein n=1 Tax=Suhomyces tanzawaensis NRRL Y-17324 TaxID=984487 RepID=A0A1E4SDN4_9ASCO|nr:uncharacterized protein CANTADRAFT_27334 [Suhomyces tanzawaensis NRRL Y-17324]ODV77593.1 hypothetical protein CANTADRAFT_27334 [Suhomyces tanzawaensis NRRL Y-17324]
MRLREAHLFAKVSTRIPHAIPGACPLAPEIDCYTVFSRYGLRINGIFCGHLITCFLVNPKIERREMYRMSHLGTRI